MQQHDNQKRGRELSGPRPGEFPLGSELSRAAARAMFDARAAESGGARQELVVCNLGNQPALSADTCIRILDDCALLPKQGMRVVRLDKIPDGLNAADLETLIRSGGLTRPVTTR